MIIFEIIPFKKGGRAMPKPEYIEEKSFVKNLLENQLVPFLGAPFATPLSFSNSIAGL